MSSELRDWIVLIVQMATLLAIVVAAWQLTYHSRQMHRDLESLYVQRNWAIMDRRSLKWLANGKPTSDDYLVLRAYLQLCEDEIDLRRRGRVTDSTWAFWAQAISEQCSAEPYATALAAAPDEEYPSLRLHLGGKTDPLSRKWLWRLMHGL